VGVLVTLLKTTWPHIDLFLGCEYSLVWTGVWTQSLAFLGRCSTTWAMQPPPSFCFWVFLFLVGLGFELRASHLSHISVHFALVILEMAVSQTVCLDWPQPWSSCCQPPK
jgi:hypothetical protein